MSGNKVIPISVRSSMKIDYNQYDLTQREANSNQCTWYGNIQMRRLSNSSKWHFCQQNSSEQNKDNDANEDDVDDETFRFRWGRCIKAFIYLLSFIFLGILVVPVIILIENYNFARYSGYIGTASFRTLMVQYSIHLMWI